MDSPKFPIRAKRSFLPPHVEIIRLDLSRLGRTARPLPMENRWHHSERIGKRLITIVNEYRICAHRVGRPLDSEALANIIHALRIESFGGNPQALLDHGDPVAAWLISSLYQELLEEPGKIFFTTSVDHDMIPDAAMPPAFWRECLAELEGRILGIRTNSAS